MSSRPTEPWWRRRVPGSEADSRALVVSSRRHQHPGVRRLRHASGRGATALPTLRNRDVDPGELGSAVESVGCAAASGESTAPAHSRRARAECDTTGGHGKTTAVDVPGLNAPGLAVPLTLARIRVPAGRSRSHRRAAGCTECPGRRTRTTRCRRSSRPTRRRGTRTRCQRRDRSGTGPSGSRPGRGR